MQRARLRTVTIVTSSFLATIVCAHRPLPETLVNSNRTSPDGKWKVAWHCDDKASFDACTITLSRQTDGRVVFHHSTFPRYIRAVWNRHSTKYLLLDAPDNANTFLWLFRTQNGDAVIEKVDYEAISAEIEGTRPEARAG
jgi:hypothetical protein